MPEAMQMQYVCYSYDIPKNIRPSDYPEPSVVLRPFATRIEQSVWVLPETMVGRADELTDKIRRLGGVVDTLRYDERDNDKIKLKARRSLEAEGDRIRKYVEASIAKTTERLAEAQAQASVDGTNAAIRYQQTALNKALREVNDAEECAVAFDLTGDLSELVRSLRSSIEARATAFVGVKDTAKSVVRDMDPASLGFGLPPQTTLPDTGTGG